mmetsp:Transcript_28586/g.76982  ORF Transcript_28586/g.76982 Transcript_28586/m.76982 type:complete len:331 (-) Transcript_28586:507-1499(-)
MAGTPTYTSSSKLRGLDAASPRRPPCIHRPAPWWRWWRGTLPLPQPPRTRRSMRSSMSAEAAGCASISVASADTALVSPSAVCHTILRAPLVRGGRASSFARTVEVVGWGAVAARFGGDASRSCGDELRASDTDWARLVNDKGRDSSAGAGAAGGALRSCGGLLLSGGPGAPGGDGAVAARECDVANSGSVVSCSSSASLGTCTSSIVCTRTGAVGSTRRGCAGASVARTRLHCFTGTGRGSCCSRRCEALMPAFVTRGMCLKRSCVHASDHGSRKAAWSAAFAPSLSAYKTKRGISSAPPESALESSRGKLTSRASAGASAEPLWSAAS